MADPSTIRPTPVHLAIGQVVDVLAGPRWYNVRLGAEAPISCIAGASIGSYNPLGPSNFAVYEPGTFVLVYIPLRTTYDQTGGAKNYKLEPPGYILCGVTDVVGSNARRVCDWIAPFTGADSVNDIVHHYPAVTFANQYKDWNVNQPMDSVPGSDAGLINELGVGYGMSRFFAWMRASDIAGLWFFYLDNLTRLAAYNYEFWHSGGERWIKNDEGEVNDVDLFTPYPWEAMGMLAPDQASMEEITDGGQYKPGQKQLWYEPRRQGQLILPRLMRVRGYLGDAERKMVIIPRIDGEAWGGTADDPFTEQYLNRTNYTGVLDIQKHTDGMYTVRSARGLVHEKYIFIPVPKQLEPPEGSDELGDGATNYKPSGYWGTDEEEAATLHTKNSWAWSQIDGSVQPDAWLAELYDFNAYLFNWYGVKPIVAHENDWYLPEEGFFANEDAPAGAYQPDESLSDTFRFPLPQFADLQIDHRTGSSRYYYSRSIISQLPDGSIIIEDGYGSSIHMGGGNIFLSGPGDVWVKPGRNVVMWAPDDLIARAGSSVDITAANADVRVKAERNLHMLSGNGGVVGGTFIENRSVYGFGGTFKFRDAQGNPLVGEDVDTYGMVIKAPNAPVMVYGRDVYTKAISYTQGGGQDVGGHIEQEASRGVVVSGEQYIRYSEQGFTDVIGQKVGDGSTLSGSIVNRFDKENTVLSSTHLCMIQSRYVCLTSTEAASGLFVSGSIGVVYGVVPYPSNTLAGMISAWSTEYNQWLTGDPGDPDTLPGMLNFYYTDIYEQGIKGNATFISVAGFTCRDQDQYGLGDDFQISETRWQQVYRQKDIGLVWYEPTVEIPGVAVDAAVRYTRPHPGQRMWLQSQQYMECDTVLWSQDDAKARDRADTEDDVPVYDDVRNKHADDTETSLRYRFLSTNYLISKQYGSTAPSATP